jgi:putative membrane protein insertion efficiency factor
MSRSIGRSAGWLIIGPLLFYRRFVSPLKPSPSCRFHPTCSAYAIEAVRVHGPARGSLLAVRRILKCHPFHPGGLDAVPPARATSDSSGRNPPAEPPRRQVEDAQFENA